LRGNSHNVPQSQAQTNKFLATA